MYHQGNTESASTKLEALPVLTVNSKRTEARLLTAEYCFSHWIVVRAPGLDGMGDAHAQNEFYLLNGALHKVLGMLWWSTSVRFHGFGGIAWSGLSFHRSA